MVPVLASANFTPLEPLPSTTPLSNIPIACRTQAGAARMSMPSVPEDQFVEAVRSCVESNLDYVSMGHVY